MPQTKFIAIVFPTSFPHPVWMAQLASYLPKLKVSVIVTFSLVLLLTFKALFPKLFSPFLSPSHYCCPILVQHLIFFFSLYALGKVRMWKNLVEPFYTEHSLLTGLPVSNDFFFFQNIFHNYAFKNSWMKHTWLSNWTCMHTCTDETYYSLEILGVAHHCLQNNSSLYLVTHQAF